MAREGGINGVSDFIKQQSRPVNVNVNMEQNNFGIKKNPAPGKDVASQLVRETISGEKGGPVTAMKNQIGKSIDVRA